MQVELLADYACRCGENPLWHPDHQRLYWTDIPTGRLFWYDPASESHEQCYEGRPVGGFTIEADQCLLLFMDRGTVAVWRDGQLIPVIEEIPDERETRFNDVIADPAGRVFCGTMPVKNQRLGRLYRLDPDHTHRVLLEGIGVSNGLGFTPDRQRLYYTDTPVRTIWLFDYDGETGAITNQRPFVEVPDREGEGGPDGMTVDAEGGVWSARWGGSCVVRYDPDGREVQRIEVPAPHVTACAFGGAELEELYITTAGGADKDKQGEAAGALFRVRPGVKGVEEFRSRIGG
jgi:D-xylonolactonase